MTPDIEAAACAAVQWAEAHPDKMIAGALANDENGDSVSTLDPKACCFCILGLVARFAVIDTSDTLKALDLTGLPGEVHRINDVGVFDGEPLRGVNFLKTFLTKECPQ